MYNEKSIARFLAGLFLLEHFDWDYNLIVSARISKSHDTLYVYAPKHKEADGLPQFLRTIKVHSKEVYVFELSPLEQMIATAVCTGSIAGIDRSILLEYVSNINKKTGMYYGEWMLQFNKNEPFGRDQEDTVHAVMIYYPGIPEEFYYNPNRWLNTPINHDIRYERFMPVAPEENYNLRNIIPAHARSTRITP